MKKDLSETIDSGDVAVSNPPLGGKPSRIRKKPKWATLVRGKETLNS